MKIFEEGNVIRLQLMEIHTRTMLFDFTIEKEFYNELREHIIEHLNKFQVKK